MRRRTREDGSKPIENPRMLCTKCHNTDLVMPGSREAGICNPCREKLTPKHLPDCQYDSYWDSYSKKRRNSVK